MSTPLTEIPGIGPSTAEVLQAHGFDSAETLAASAVKKVSEVPGFGEIRAAAVLKAANAIVDIEESKQKQVKNKDKKAKSKKDKDKKKGKKKSKPKDNKGKSKKNKNKDKKDKNKKKKKKK